MDPQQLKFLDVSVKWNHFLAIFGLENTKEMGRKAKKVRYVPSPLKIIYAVFLQILYLSLFYVHVAYFRYETNKNVLNFYVYYSGFPLAALMIFVNLLQTKNVGLLITKLIDCELRFHKSDGKLIAERSRMLMIGFLLTFTISVAYDSFWLHLEGATYELMFLVFSSYIFLFYNHLVIVHFSILQIWLQNSIDRINEGLVYVCKMEFEIDSVFKSRRPSNGFFSQKAKNNKMIASEIRNLRSLYNEVFEISIQLNQVFAKKNLIIVAANFLMIILVLFNTLNRILKYSNDPQLKYAVEIGSGLKACFLTISTIFGLIWSCGKTCDEASKTLRIIENNLIQVNNQDTKRELKDFVKQLLHEKIHFSPNGFFVLENKMLLSMLSAVASYLVILLQFTSVNGPSQNETL